VCVCVCHVYNTLYRAAAVSTVSRLLIVATLYSFEGAEMLYRVVTIVWFARLLPIVSPQP